jgi:hypothetical protein
MSSLQVLTGTAVTQLTVIAPLLSLSSTDVSGTSVVADISKTLTYSADSGYVQMIYSFELLAALLDSAPTNTGGTGTNIFQMVVKIPGTTVPAANTKYVIDAMIQTKGNSALSPTYITKVNADGDIFFPVTNFFTVTSPGSPYTITITMTKVIV